MSWETIQFANGKYVGDTAYINGEKVRHGFGKMHWNYSDTYEGYWHNDEMHTINGEKGTYKFLNGNVYEGQIRYGEICGVGCLRTKKVQVITANLKMVSHTDTALSRSLTAKKFTLDGKKVK